VSSAHLADAVDKMDTHEAITRVVVADDDGYYDCDREDVDNTAAAVVDVAVGVGMDGLDDSSLDDCTLVKRMGHLCCDGYCR
jgi:hypothetical protein